jgi:hypothetical protein
MGDYFDGRYYAVTEGLWPEFLGGFGVFDGEVSDARAAQGGEVGA